MASAFITPMDPFEASCHYDQVLKAEETRRFIREKIASEVANDENVRNEKELYSFLLDMSINLDTEKKLTRQIRKLDPRGPTWEYQAEDHYFKTTFRKDTEEGALEVDVELYFKKINLHNLRGALLEGSKVPVFMATFAAVVSQPKRLIVSPAAEGRPRTALDVVDVVICNTKFPESSKLCWRAELVDRHLPLKELAEALYEEGRDIVKIDTKDFVQYYEDDAGLSLERYDGHEIEVYTEPFDEESFSDEPEELQEWTPAEAAVNYLDASLRLWLAFPVWLQALILILLIALNLVSIYRLAVRL